MRVRQWPKANKVRGRPFVRATHKFEPEFLEALKEYAGIETARLRRTISQATILSTLAIEGDAKFRRLYQRRLQAGTSRPTGPS